MTKTEALKEEFKPFIDAGMDAEKLCSITAGIMMYGLNMEESMKCYEIMQKMFEEKWHTKDKPTTEGRYLITIQGEVTVATYINGKWHYEHVVLKDEWVEAWKALPNPYKEDPQ